MKDKQTISTKNQVPLPSGTSIGTKKRRATEKKNATIRQHYYPEVDYGRNTSSLLQHLEWQVLATMRWWLLSKNIN